MQDDISNLRQILQKVDFFYSLHFDELDLLIKALRKRKVAPGTVIIKQGDKGGAFCLINNGRVSIYIRKGLVGQKKVAELVGGSFFGEIALVKDEPRTATVIAEEPTELFVLYKSDFKKILLNNPRISEIINMELQKRKLENK